MMATPPLDISVPSAFATKVFVSDGIPLAYKLARLHSITDLC
jgi:hypothetical protein